jgi:hypothetical protein
VDALVNEIRRLFEECTRKYYYAGGSVTDLVVL